MAPLSSGNKKLDHSKIVVRKLRCSCICVQEYCFKCGLILYTNIHYFCFDQDLNRSALEFAKIMLTEGGCFLCKLWDGNETGGMSRYQTPQGFSRYSIFLS